MVIDFHTHIYPDHIASRTIEKLEQCSDVIRAFTDGTLGGLLESMSSSGIDKSVILPVATRKGQFDSINRFAEQINKNYENLVSFGGIHPDDDEPERKLEALKESGFKGIKIHPDYQGTFIDDERYVRILTHCARLGLKVVTHAGVDPAFDVIHCPPDRARQVLDRITAETGVTEPFMIFAHLGGIFVREEFLEHLAGTSCYIDISCGFADIGSYCDSTDEDVVRVIKTHGADRVLFATDSPWNGQQEYLKHFKALKGLTEKEKDLILYKNAEQILNYPSII